MRSCGNSATVRASVASVNDAQMAVKTFSASGTQAAGNQRNGNVSRHSSGWDSIGCQFHPFTLVTRPRLFRVTQWLSVAR